MRYKNKILYLLSAVTSLSLLVPPATVFAGTGAIYLTPSSTGLQVNSTTSLSLRISPGTTVDGVQATISFNASQLRLNSVDTSSSPFTVQLQKSVSASSATIALGNLSGGVSSDSLIAYLSFTALTDTGSAAVSISNANATSGGSYTNPSVAGANISLTAPPAAPVSAPSPVSGASSPTKLSAGGSSKKQTTETIVSTSEAPAKPITEAPKVTSSVQSKGFKSAKIKVTSSVATNMYLRYGIGKDLSKRTPLTENVTSAVFTLGTIEDPLIPGTSYMYQTVAVASDGTETNGSLMRFETAGHTLLLTVLNAQNQPLGDIDIRIGMSDIKPEPRRTNEAGIAEFIGLAPGVHHVQYLDPNGKKFSAVVYIEDTTGNTIDATKAAVQNAAVIFKTSAAIRPVSATTSNQLAATTAVIFTLTAGALALSLSRHFRLHRGTKLETTVLDKPND